MENETRGQGAPETLQFEQVRLPALTVVLTNGRRFSANGIYTTMDEKVVFLCSGNMLSFPATEIERVEFTPSIYTHCPHCDQNISAMKQVKK